jgi:hypothetical protein
VIGIPHCNLIKGTRILGLSFVVMRWQQRQSSKGVLMHPTAAPATNGGPTPASVIARSAVGSISLSPTPTTIPLPIA